MTYDWRRARPARPPSRPAARPDSIAAGLHVVVHLPGDRPDAAVVAAARRRGVAVVGLSEHCVERRGPGLILGYGLIDEHAIEPGVAELARAMREAALTRGR